HYRDISRPTSRWIISRIADYYWGCLGSKSRIDRPVGIARRHTKVEILAGIPIALGDLCRFTGNRLRISSSHHGGGTVTRLIRPHVPNPKTGIEHTINRIALSQFAIYRFARLPKGRGTLAGKSDWYPHPGTVRTNSFIQA